MVGKQFKCTTTYFDWDENVLFRVGDICEVINCYEGFVLLESEQGIHCELYSYELPLHFEEVE